MAFKAFVTVPISPDRDAGCQKGGCHSDAIFFENFFDSFGERESPFSFLSLSLQTREIFVSFCHTSLCGFSGGEGGVFILDDRPIFFVLALQLAFELFQLIKCLGSVEPFFQGVSMTFFRCNSSTEGVEVLLGFFSAFGLFFKRGFFFFSHSSDGSSKLFAGSLRLLGHSLSIFLVRWQSGPPSPRSRVSVCRSLATLFLLLRSSSTTVLVVFQLL